MTDTQETTADIRKDAEAKFRELVESYMQRRAAFQTTVGAMQAFNTVFDRLEAAIKRERAKIEADALEVCGIVEAARKRELGDAAAMREALMQIYDRVNSLDEDCGVDPVEIRDIARAALAEPVKNCDVGTAEEQAERFAEYCDSEVCKRKRCKSQAKALCIELCALAWAQMPYEEGGAK